MHYIEYPFELKVNGYSIRKVRIGQHYRDKHAAYMNDELILELVNALHDGFFEEDSSRKGISYFATDVSHTNRLGRKLIYRIIWIIEGSSLEILGVINAYRRKKQKKGFTKS